MGNTLITPSVIAKEALLQLENNVCMANLVHRDYKKEFVKVGSTVSIRKPVKFVASDGATRVNQDVSESTTSIVIDKQKHVSWEFSAVDLTLTIEEYSKRYIEPACIALANQVDRDLCGLYIDLYNSVGTVNSTPTAYTTFAAAARRLDEEAVPDDGKRVVVLDPAAAWSLIGNNTAGSGITTLFNEEVVRKALREGYLGMLANMKTYKNQNISLHTPGSDFTTVTITTAGQTGSTITSAGGNFLKGDMFSIAAVNAVNPISRQSTGVVRNFVCTADGTTSLSIRPSIISSGAYQTVNTTNLVNAVMTAIGTASTAYTNSLAFHKNCFALVMIPIELPDSCAFKGRETHNNLSIAVVKDFDIDTYKEVIRLDVLYGVKTIYPEFGVRILG